MYLNSKISSRITSQVLSGGEVKNQLMTHNIMTDYGLQAWAQGSLGSHLALGSGSRAEVGNITSLAAHVRTTSGVYSYSDINVIDDVAGVMRSNHTLTVTYPIETVNRNYSEIGIHNNNVNQLQTYALLSDSTGQTTSQTVLAGEQLRVYYTVQFAIPLLHSEVKMINGVSTTVSTVPLYTGRDVLARLPRTSTNYLWAAGQPVPTAGKVPSGGVGAPTASRSGNTSTIALNDTQGNLTGGISMVRAGDNSNNIGLLIHFDPPIQKTSAHSAKFITAAVLSNGDFHES